MYPVMIVLLKGFSVYVFLYFTIIIMAYFIVRLYAKQTIAAKKCWKPKGSTTRSFASI